MTTLEEYRRNQHRRYVDFYRSCKEALGDVAPSNKEIQNFVDSFLAISAPVESKGRSASRRENDESYMELIVAFPSNSLVSIKPGNIVVNFWKFLGNLLDGSLAIAGLGDGVVLKVGTAVSVVIKIFSALKIEIPKLEAFLLLELFRLCGAGRSIDEEDFILHVLKIKESAGFVQVSRSDIHLAVTALAKYRCIRLCDGKISINEKVHYPF